MKRILLSLYIFLPLLAACYKDKMPPPAYQPGVFFYRTYNTNGGLGNTDSAGVAFAFSGKYSFYFHQDRTQDTFWFPTVRVMGKALPQDRRIDLEVTGGNGVAGMHYQLLDYVMPADSLTAKLGIVIFSKALADSTLNLTLQFKPNADFPATSLDSVIAGQYYYSNTFHLQVTNRPIEPPYWSNVSIYMGDWSMVKYAFITDVLGRFLGVTDNPDDITNGYADYLRVTTALARYNLEHPDYPMRDENGQFVQFN